MAQGTPSLSGSSSRVFSAGPAAWTIGSSMGIATTPRGRARQAERVGNEILRGLASKARPDTLTESELEFDKYPVTRPATARPVWVWVRYGAIPIRVEGELCAWTDAHAAVRWRVPGIGIHRAWVWGNAIQIRESNIPGE